MTGCDGSVFFTKFKFESSNQLLTTTQLFRQITVYYIT